MRSTKSSTGPVAPARRQIRGDVTRNRVIEAAIEEFGTHGFEGTGTRALAQRAGTNLTAIRYHFGGKEGLYRAAAEHIATGMRQRLSVGLEPVLRVASDTHATHEDVIRAIGTLLETIAAQVTGGIPDTWVTFVTREQLHPGAAFDVMFSTVRRFLELLADLVGRLIRQPGTSPDARVLALMLFGQVAVFRTHRAAALRALGWRELGPEQQRLLRAALAKQTATQLRALAQLSQSSPTRTRARRAGTGPSRR